MDERKIALDLDGTLVSRGWTTEDPPIIDHALLQQLKDEGITRIDICTNQAGIMFGFRSGDSFIKVIDWLSRVAYNDYGIEIGLLLVSLYHPKAKLDLIEQRNTVAELLIDTCGLRFDIFTTEEHRKPNPTMLTLCGCTEYWGDSPEDEQAALAAGKTHKQVEEFEK